MQKKLIVVGGGASGFFCAVNAKRMNPALDVTIVEKSGKVLSKVRISGGGRCNVTHENFEIPYMSARYPRGSNLVKKTFHQFFTTDTIEWFRSRGVMLRGEQDGRMFPVTNTSETIIDCLMREMNQQGVRLLYNRDVKRITKQGDQWSLLFSEGVMLTDYVCIACGGYPKASSFSWLTETGHHIEEPVPSLFTFNMPGNPVTALMGVSVENAQIKIAGTKLQETGPLLITHWGMSGPAVLRLSAWGAHVLAEVQYKFSVLVNWLPSLKEPELRDQIRSLRESISAQKISGRNPFGLPQRLWEFIVVQAEIKPDWRWADLPSVNQNRLINNLCAQEFGVSGKTTYKEEFVTAGGIRLNEIDANTMESKLLPGIFFAGEIMNVDGITGGFNFQHAWTSGYIVAKTIAERSLRL
ncbi:MAG TPA: NAD(P)/FAD-dependent oxidoreductase [Flavitalea sp.]|nr:NAD(P)/FAD-dependent oxidoreductase [Flavitalea sp.]